jgi:MYXO-CTERM domain-containing protein
MSAQRSSATLIAGNLNSGINGNWGMSSTAARAASRVNFGGGFAGADLTFVTLMLQAPSTPVLAHAWLYSGTSSAVGSQLDDLGSQIIASTSPTNYDFTASGPFPLQANQTYWVVVGPDQAGSLSWLGTNSTTLDAGSDAAASIPSSGADSGNSGATWFYPNGIAGKFAVNATPAPEPTAVGVLGLATVLMIRRRAR